MTKSNDGLAILVWAFIAFFSFAAVALVIENKFYPDKAYPSNVINPRK